MGSRVTKFDKSMSAVTFAEAGEFETAKEFLGEEPQALKEKKPVGADAKKKPYAGMLIFGAVSLSGYIALITHQQWVNETYTMGGWHAAYPVVTALIFSFVHGAFASNLLSVLGIEAKKK
jgi:hypothetical protein